MERQTDKRFIMEGVMQSAINKKYRQNIIMKVKSKITCFKF